MTIRDITDSRDNFFSRFNGDVAVDVRGAANAAEVVEACGLTEKVTKKSLTIGGTDIVVPNQYALVRGEGTPLGVVGSQYVPHQDVNLLGLFDSLQGFGGFAFHSAGSMFGSSVVWAQAEIGEKFTLIRADGSEDTMARRLFIMHSHGAGVNGNAQTPLVITPTALQFNCSNQFPALTRSSKQNGWRIPHTVSADRKLKIAMEAIRGSLVAQSETFALAEELEAFRMERQQVRSFAETLLLDMEATLDDLRAGKVKDEDGETVKLSTRKENQVDSDAEAITDLFQNGTGNCGKTGWDAFSGLTEWIDHKRESSRVAARNAEGRFHNAYMSEANGPGLKRRGMRRLVGLARR